jgi:hypothetical protein
MHFTRRYFTMPENCARASRPISKNGAIGPCGEFILKSDRPMASVVRKTRYGVLWPYTAIGSTLSRSFNLRHDNGS